MTIINSLPLINFANLLRSNKCEFTEFHRLEFVTNQQLL